MNILLLGMALAQGDWNDSSRKDLHRYVRSVSLDLRGHVPTKEELLLIEEEGALSDELLDSWLSSDAFEDQVVTYHRSLFWNKLNTQLVQKRRLQKSNGVYYLPSNRTRYRGDRITCGDFEATFDENGELIPQILENGSIQEGWLYKTAYWEPDTQVKICAFEAQEDIFSSDGTECESSVGHTKLDCGCGPDLQWCFLNSERTIFTNSFSTEIDERVRMMLKEELSYDQFLVQPFAQVNGPLVHLFRYIYPFDDSLTPYVDVDLLPDLSYEQKDTWEKIELPEHSQGVFSSGGWLLRHQTNRGRANRFYGGILCKEFIPIENEIGGLTGTELPSPDLSRREGCVDCHARLEPLASYWARWGEASQSYIDPERYPSFSEECSTCMNNNSCSSTCKNNYVVSVTHPDETPYVGWLKTFAFLNDSELANPDLGPSEWVYKSLSDGSLASCAAKNTSNWLLGWSEDDQVRDSFAAGFTESGYSFRGLIRNIIRSDAYWSQQ